MIRVILSGILLVHWFGGAATDCTAEEPAQALKIGLLLCQSGACAQTGTSALKGAQLAAEEINTAGGILGRRIKLVIQDTREADSGAGTMTAFRAVTSDSEVRLLVGPSWDVGGLPLVPLLQRNPNLLLVSPSIGVKEFSAGSENIFNLWPLDEVSVKELAQYSIQQAWRRAAILSAQNNWAEAQAQNFKTAYEGKGGSIVRLEEPLSTQTDLKTEALRIISAKPDVVLFTMFAHMPVAAQELRQLGFKGAFLSVQMDQNRVEAANGALDGTVFPQFQKASPTFVKAFQKRFSDQPQMAADTGYDAVYLFYHAAARAGDLTTDKMRSEMAGLSWEGASGRIAFDGKRVVLRAPSLYQVSGKDYVKVGD